MYPALTSFHSCVSDYQSVIQKVNTKDIFQITLFIK